MDNIITVDDFEKLIGGPTADRIRKKAAKLRGCEVANVNATYYGGGVAELLSSMTLLMNSLGIKAEWRTITGVPDFFDITKNMHNALQSGDMDLTPKKKRIYEEINYENSIRNHLDQDFVVIHDPQPLPLINHYKKKGPWIWRCHIDLSNPHKKLWKYLEPSVNKYDAAIYTIKAYSQKTRIPEVFYPPAINPFSLKNKDLTKKQMDAVLKKYKIPTDRPIVTQVSRFDIWKDPEGVIRAAKLAQKKVDFTLILLGNMATDDPEGQEVLQSLLDKANDRIRIMSCGDDTVLVNTLQRRSAVVLQKSTKEGFGLTVTEALWKGTPVIGGKVGGIPTQVQDGYNGYLVSSVNQAADRIVKLLKNKGLRKRMGKNAKESVRKNFLMTRLLEQYLDLFNSFETTYKFRK